VRGDDCAELPAATLGAVERALDRGEDPVTAFRASIPDPDDEAFYVDLLERALVQGRQELKTERALARVAGAMGVSAEDPRVRHRLAAIIIDMLDPNIDSTAGDVVARVTGEPVLDRALSRSVARNQIRTMALGLGVVLLLLVFLFGSLRIALVCVAPALLTAVLLGGLMGLLGVEIDLSTAMVGAIMTDTATDFGMHFLWYLRRDGPEETLTTVGPIMIVSNVLVALGFFAFALGDSPVMHLFGALSGATCVVSVVLTCVLAPALWRWARPRRRSAS
jgi:predicted RND superfamily exporter protein